MTISADKAARGVSRSNLLRRIAITFVMVLAGCVQKTPVPYMARVGDTIMLGLGGIQRNLGGEQHLQSTDLQITITPTAGGTPIALNALYMFKAYPDYGSLLNTNAINGSMPSFSAFDGGWFVAVTLPNDGTLTPGSYLVSVTSPTGKLLNTKYASGYISEGDLTQLPLEIVAGTGSNSAYALQFSGYMNTASLDISPNNLNGVSAVAGLQLYITYPKAAYYDSNHLPIVAPYSHNPFIQLAQNTIDNSTTETLVVMLSTQQAFVPPAQQTPLTPLLSDLSLRVQYFIASGQTAPSSVQIASDFQIDQSRSHYYDTTGAVITTMQPVLSYKAQ